MAETGTTGGIAGNQVDEIILRMPYRSCMAAKSSGCHCVVTCNAADFTGPPVPALPPEELLAQGSDWIDSCSLEPPEVGRGNNCDVVDLLELE